ncbi:hypothetical protein C7974DRAFT_442713 [Boeremia exigua]|uniref:uncharacterized protein n=1 Tax=Boeremia exigua TaxID=749465 RepID=UPI001E8EBEA8|nr:uncharacterized protein C7974DRAFT_442713 [Boeremia exigua]KAH6616862.1 hypothetical protein C7974DRAFT_442713 [Boeremia exigua]
MSDYTGRKLPYLDRKQLALDSLYARTMRCGNWWHVRFGLNHPYRRGRPESAAILPVCKLYHIQVPLCIPVLVVLALWAPCHGSLSDTATGRNAFVVALKGFDWLGSTASLVFLFVFLTTGGNVYPWLSLPVLGAGIGLLIAAYILVRVESAKENPIVEIQMVCSYPVRNLMLTGLLLNMTNYVVMYYVPVFSQAVLLDTPEEAGIRLMVPSVSFTATSALSSYLIAHIGSPLPTLYLSQVFLIFGTASLLSVMLISLKSALPSIVITLLLTLPVIGASMMAPSALMTLLNTVDEEKCAVVNSNFILARSLGYFAATTLGATVLQNTYSRFIEGLGLSQADFEVIAQSRLGSSTDRLQKAKQAQRAVSKASIC